MNPNSPLQPIGSPTPAARRIDDIQPPRPFSSSQPTTPLVQQPAQPVTPQPTPMPPATPYYQEPLPPVQAQPQPLNTQTFFQPSLQASPITSPVQDTVEVQQNIPPLDSQASSPQSQVNQMNPISGVVPGSLFTPPTSSFDKVNIPDPFAAKNSKGGGLIKRLIIVLIGLLILGGLAFGVFLFLAHAKSGPIKLNESDLQTSSQNGFSYSIPKSWVNATSKLTTLQDSLSSSGGVDNATIYVDKLRKTTDGKYSPAYAYLLSGSSNSGTTLTPAEFKTTISTNAKLKDSFEQTISQQFTAETLKSYAGSKCSRVDNYKNSYSYNTPTNFEILLVVNGDCLLSSADAKIIGTPQIHIAMEIGFTEKNMYILSLAAFQQSWDLNQTVFNTMLSSFKGN